MTGQWCAGAQACGFAPVDVGASERRGQRESGTRGRKAHEETGRDVSKRMVDAAVLDEADGLER